MFNNDEKACRENIFSNIKIMHGWHRIAVLLRYLADYINSHLNSLVQFTFVI